MIGGVGLAACVAVGQLQAPKLKVPLRVLGLLWFYFYSLALQDKITTPLPGLARKSSRTLCFCPSGDRCSGCPASPKRLKITDVMCLADEKVLKLFSSVWLLILNSTCLLQFDEILRAGDREVADPQSVLPDQPVTGRSWSLLIDTRVPRDGSDVAAPASPVPELAAVIGSGPDLDWDVALPSSPVQPCSSTSTQPLTSAQESKSCNAIPAAAVSPVRLNLPRAKLVLQRLADWQLPAPQVLKFCVGFL